MYFYGFNINLHKSRKIINRINEIIEFSRINVCLIFQ